MVMMVVLVVVVLLEHCLCVFVCRYVSTLCACLLTLGAAVANPLLLVLARACAACAPRRLKPCVSARESIVVVGWACLCVWL